LPFGSPTSGLNAFNIILFTMRETSGLSFCTLRDEASLVALQTEWEDLFQRAVVRTPFLRYFWARLSWHRRRFDQSAMLFIVLVRDSGRLVLIAPLVARRSHHLFLSLSFLDSRTSQYNDVLVEDSARTPEYVAYFWTTLCKLRRIRRLRLSQLRDDSLLTPYLVGARFGVNEAGSAPFIDVTQFGNWETFFGSLSKKLRTDHRRQIRHLERLGSVDFRFANDRTLLADITWLFAAKRQWLKRTQLVSDWFTAPGTEELFATAAAEGLGAGRTWLTVLSLDGKTIAANLSFREDFTLFVSKIAFDFEWQLYSPGRTLILLTLEHAFKEGLTKCDLMIGEGTWKRTIAKERVRVTNKTVKLHPL
jgi:CelD/BcsL family acetyltransferase involved in cellulose biosynthesis